MPATVLWSFQPRATSPPIGLSRSCANSWLFGSARASRRPARSLPGAGARRIARRAGKPASQRRCGGAGQAVGARRVPAFCSGCPHNRSTASLPGTIVRRRGRLPLHRLPGGPPRRRRDPAADPDGRRGRAMDRGGQIRAGGAHLPEPRRRDLCPFRSLAIRACVAAGVNITFKLLVQRRRRHDGRPRRAGRHGGAGNDARARGARCPPSSCARPIHIATAATPASRPAHRCGRGSGSPRPRRRWRGNRGSPH